ncbi:CAP domain-containing protein [Burkholderia vietnamiensis]|uniref:Allergen V5/Tpx-1 family protein n=1 Tax=Burkholderia vietnamiensis (strain G4 / LMG 22486) TaxID=269482 RepID=A4JFI2_BURVG|nr:Allergen V5/Tpx-1 family protein [Burkholderia vietnamiensis G4]MCB4344794.1 CAP domain-containing protein [Burkholderia vietnamiensis]
MKHATSHAQSRAICSPSRHRTRPSLRLAGCAFAAASLLAACGGGGGGSGGSTTGSGGGTSSSSPTSAATAPIALVAAPGASTGAFTATGDVVNDTLSFINAQRAQVGLASLAFQSGVAHAAANHALWEQDNNVIGHVETAGQAGYTAATPTDRVNLYYATTSVGEVTAGFGGSFTSSTEAISGLFDAPFHRAIMLFDSVYAGPGDAVASSASQLSTLTVDFADYKQVVQDNELIAWPYNGMTNVNTSWYASESPNPMAQTTQSQAYENTIVGYPVTLSGSNNAAFSNVSFIIRNAAGATIPCQEVDNSNNSDATREAMCVPFEPLATNTVYTVSVTGSLSNNAFAARPFSLTWSFTTAATANTPVGAPTSSTTTSTSTTSTTTTNSQSEAKAARQLQQLPATRTVLFN